MHVTGRSFLVSAPPSAAPARSSSSADTRDHRNFCSVTRNLCLEESFSLLIEKSMFLESMVGLVIWSQTRHNLPTCLA